MDKDMKLDNFTTGLHLIYIKYLIAMKVDTMKLIPCSKCLFKRVSGDSSKKD